MSDFALAVAEVEKTPNYAVAQSDMEDGTNERRLLHESPVCSWKVTSPVLTAEQAQTYQDFFDSKFGALTSFTWTCPLDGVEYTVNFIEGSFRIKKSRGEIRVEWEFERNLNA
jgi:phage-related protein